MKLPNLSTITLLVVLTTLTFILLTYFLLLGLGQLWAGYILNALSLVLSIFFSALFGLWNLEIKDILVKTYENADKNSFSGKIALILRKLYSKFAYPDLSVLVLAILLLIYYVTASFDIKVQELVSKGLLDFPKNLQGDLQLAAYLKGFVATPLLAVSFAFYGFNNGFNLRAYSLSKLFYSVFLGVVLYALINTFLKGGWTGIENINQAKTSLGAQLPVDSIFVYYFIYIVTVVIIIILITIYISIFFKTGKFLRKRINKNSNKKININDASERKLMEVLHISSDVAKKVLSLKKRITVSNLTKANGIGNEKLKLAKEHFIIDAS